MSQLGMQLPGSQSRRTGSMNVYTGLLFVAVCCLVAALAVVYLAGSRLAPGGQAWKVHPEGQRIDLQGLGR